MQTLADTYTENTEFLNKLADQTEDFAVQLIDQVTASEQLAISDVPENADRCGSMLSDITDDAIIHSQKKVSIYPFHRAVSMSGCCCLKHFCKTRENRHVLYKHNGHHEW